MYTGLLYRFLILSFNQAAFEIDLSSHKLYFILGGQNNWIKLTNIILMFLCRNIFKSILFQYHKEFMFLL